MTRFKKPNLLPHITSALFITMPAAFCAVDTDVGTVETPFAAPKEPTPPRYSKQPVIERIKGILLVPRQEYVEQKNTWGISGLQAHDVCVPGGLKSLCEQLEPLFMNQPLTQELLQKLKEEIVLYYRSHDHPVVAVYVPEQDVTDGVLQIVVLEGCVGQIAASGNCWFSSSFYERSIRLGSGEAITSDTLLTDVAWINRNPFRDVDVVFTPGCDPGTTNIELVVCDRFPLQVYAGADNTGTGPSGTARYFAGATWGNAFWLDQVLTYQYTTSNDFKEFQSHTGHWTVPLPWHHLFLAYGGYFTVNGEDEDFTSEGTGFDASVRYSVPFGVNYCGKLQEATIGFDFKNTNNNFLFVADEPFAIITSVVNLSQFVLGYAYGCETCWCRFFFNLDLYWSPGKLFPDESDELYNMLTPNAKVQYIYGKMILGQTWWLPMGWSFSALARLQLASQNLLPSERFGIGGYDTVRGYPERELNVDNALVLNAEIRTPTFSLLEFFNCCNCCDEMLLLVFFDYGLGNINNRSTRSLDEPIIGPTFKVTEYLMSVGPGVRYTINRYLAARVDWGIKLHRGIFSGRSRSGFNAGIVVSY